MLYGVKLTFVMYPKIEFYLENLSSIQGLLGLLCRKFMLILWCTTIRTKQRDRLYIPYIIYATEGWDRFKPGRFFPMNLRWVYVVKDSLHILNFPDKMKKEMRNWQLPSEMSYLLIYIFVDFIFILTQLNIYS